MRDVLGLPPEPWLGVALRAAEVGPPRPRPARSSPAARTSSRSRFLRAGSSPRRGGRSDWRRPVGSSSRCHGRDRQPRPWRWPAPEASRPTPAGEPVPAGSQRGLAVAARGRRRGGRRARLLRQPDDRDFGLRRAGAGGRGRLRAHRLRGGGSRSARSSRTTSIPERALADHAFAHRLQARAGCASGDRARARWLWARTSPAASPRTRPPAPDGPWLSRRWAWSWPWPTVCRPTGCFWARCRSGSACDGDAPSILVQAWLRRRRRSAGTAWWSAVRADGLDECRSRRDARRRRWSGAPASLVVEPVLTADIAPASANLRRGGRSRGGDAVRAGRRGASRRRRGSGGRRRCRPRPTSWSDSPPMAGGASSARPAGMCRRRAAGQIRCRWSAAVGPDVCGRLLTGLV